MSQDVVLDRVTMRFGAFTAVEEVSLRIEPGEFFAFLGPSGCGKTTILRLISGFMEPSEGAVRIGGVDMRGIGPNRRPTALIFQNLALFPLMPVWENIAFGLEVRGVGKADRRKRAEQLLELVALPDAADKRVSELSGGQKQRVAIARALAVEPKVMLLDEPLSALDLKLRQHMRAELRAIQRRTGVTFVYITHDQGEALTMADRVAVMSKGVIQQVGPPSEVYDDPRTLFAASFVGENNAFPGRVRSHADGLVELDTGLGRLRGRARQPLRQGDGAILFVRPERLALGDGPAGEGGNRLGAKVDHVDFEGSFANLFLVAPDGTRLMVQLKNDGHLPSLPQGSALVLGFRPEQAVVLPAAGAEAGRPA
ncbi:MAG TPA: ABC transporter ATP-binding protein [Geminicoccaceae bacterium]|nr:ABC transporter ATP-binding protein [Geminicoccaceae bacterium]